MWCLKLIRSALSALTFYTTIPLPPAWTTQFDRIARWAPAIGVWIGTLLGSIDLILSMLQMPQLTRSALIVAAWIAITGGLHLDGVMDTADGLAVSLPERRLEVMKDSNTGAFGVMAAIIVILLKTTALSDLDGNRTFCLIAAASWGRWGQVMAIALYPNLRPDGKGAFHKRFLSPARDIFLGLFFILGSSGFQIYLNPHQWGSVVESAIAGCAVALLSGWWFYRQLKGHTGDTYGAVVEWTEAMLLCLLASLFNF